MENDFISVIERLGFKKIDDGLYKNEGVYMMEKNHRKHKQLCDDLNALYVTKNKEYGDSFTDTYEKLGIISAVTQILHKTNRIVKMSKEQEVVHESLEDNLIDLANYCLMTLMELEKTDAKK